MSTRCTRADASGLGLFSPSPLVGEGGERGKLSTLVLNVVNYGMLKICVVVGVVAVNSLAAAASTATAAMAIITQDQAYLRAAPRDSAQQQAVLSHGEVVEVRAD